MGDLGSSRPKRARRFVDDAVGLEVTPLVRAAVAHDGHCTARIEDDRRPGGAISVEVDLHESVVEVTFGEMAILVELDVLPLPRRGGAKWFWRCVSCGARSAVVFPTVDDEAPFACRTCAQLKYRSQYRDARCRLVARARRLRRRLGISESLVDDIPDELVGSNDEEVRQIVDELIEIERTVLERATSRRVSLDRLRERHGLEAGK